MGKWQFIGLRQRLCLDLEHPILPKSKEVLKKQKTNQKLGMLKENRSQRKRTTNGRTWNNWGNKINKVAYNLKYKINIQKSTTEQITFSKEEFQISFVGTHHSSSKRWT